MIEYKYLIIGGFLMPRSYFNIQQYEKEILEMKKQGMLSPEIAKRLGLKKDQIQSFLKRYEKNKRRIAAGFLPKKKGKQEKNDTTAPDPYENLKMEIYKREVTIKRLTMENELLRDFRSLIERK